MTTDEYVPSDQDIEKFYALGRVEWSPGSDITPSGAHDEFRAWLARVLREATAEARDEGKRASCGCDLSGMTPPAVHIVDRHEAPTTRGSTR